MRMLTTALRAFTVCYHRTLRACTPPMYVSPRVPPALLVAGMSHAMICRSDPSLVATASRPGSELFVGLVMGFNADRATRGLPPVLASDITPATADGLYFTLGDISGFDTIPMHPALDAMDVAARCLAAHQARFPALREALGRFGPHNSTHRCPRCRRAARTPLRSRWDSPIFEICEKLSFFPKK